MAVGKISMEDVLADIEEQGGIGASVQNGYGYSVMPNPDLRELWAEAEGALQAIADYLGIEG